MSPACHEPQRVRPARFTSFGILTFVGVTVANARILGWIPGVTDEAVCVVVSAALWVTAWTGSRWWWTW